MALKLGHTPGEYDGTFWLTLKFLVNDMLSDTKYDDDASFPATVAYRTNGWGEHPEEDVVTTGRIIAVENDVLVLDLGGAQLRIQAPNIIGIELSS